MHECTELDPCPACGEHAYRHKETCAFLQEIDDALNALPYDRAGLRSLPECYLLHGTPDERMEVILRITKKWRDKYSA